MQAQRKFLKDKKPTSFNAKIVQLLIVHWYYSLQNKNKKHRQVFEWQMYIIA